MISVIIPTYKAPEALDLCLASIIEGQKNQNEIIVVVDGFFDLNKEVLTKYSTQINILNLPNNMGTCRATNIGVYHASNSTILIANDDNVFAKNWDVHLINDFQRNSVLTVNEIEPYASIFPQKHIKDLGRDPKIFDLTSFWEYSDKISKPLIEDSGSTFPIMIEKKDFMRLGGFDENYPSQTGAVSDWDFFVKCSLSNIKTIRTYSCHFYHFVSLSSKSEEMIKKNKDAENHCHEYGRFKWGSYIKHNSYDNSKYI